MDENRLACASKPRLVLTWTLTFLLGCAIVVGSWYCAYAQESLTQLKCFLSGLGLALTICTASVLVLSRRCASAAAFRTIFLAGTAVLVGFVWAFFRIPTPADDDVSKCQGDYVRLVGTVVEVRQGQADDLPGKPCQRFVQAVLSCRSLSGKSDQPDRRISGKLLVNLRAEPMFVLKEGDRACAQVRILPLLKPRGQWQWDARSTMARQGIFAQTYAKCSAIQLCGATAAESAAYIGPALAESAIARRRQITTIHKSFLGDEQGALLSSIVFGEHAVCLNEQTKDSFRAAGLAHVLAASGFNLTIVIAFACWLSGAFSRSRRVASLVGGVSVIGYVWMAGITASIMRAAIMCFLILFARGLYRHPSILCVLSISATVACFLDPFCLADIGFQLSYVATIAIICGAAPAAEAFVRRYPRCPRFLADLAAGTLFAQVAVLPLQLWHFKESGLWFLPANLLVVPIVPLVSILGFMSSAVAMLGGAQCTFVVHAIDWFCRFPLNYMTMVVNFVSELPMASVALGAPSLAQIVMFYLGLWLGFVSIKASHLRGVALLGMVASSVVLFWRPPLADQIVIKLKGGTVLIRADRTAVLMGTPPMRTVRRILACYGAVAAPSTCRKLK